MDLRSRLAQLAKLKATGPVISVYLNTRWTDEHQRERVRIFLKTELKRARDAGRADPDDLAWIEARGRSLIEQTEWPDASGVALFACRAAGLREAFPVRVAFDDTFVVNDRPYLVPLASVADDAPPSLVVFIDGTSARLIPLDVTGPGDELVLEAQVEGRHSSGGWAALAQSRYQRHIETHREQHFAAVAAAVTGWSDHRDAERIVLAGEPRMVAALREHVPDRVARRVVGAVAGTRYEPASALVERAAALLGQADRVADESAVERAITEAAKGGHAVDGLDRTLDAVNRGAVRHLFLLRDFREVGRACEGCGALQRGLGGACAYCRRPTRPVPLDEELVDRVIASGGTVTRLARHAALAQRGGILAVLRYAA